jgi:3-methylcrotonyl-CoA carboxylase alpha subunit
LEVNTRLQVEHPVTEEITGLDLVRMQIECAEGRPLDIQQSDVRSECYAIECRLYAEDAENDFMPATGKVLHWECPEISGLRVETGIASGSEVSVYYDPMIAKIICHAQDRETAHRKMGFALRNLRCMGLTTNQDFLIALMGDTNFQAGNYDTHFLKKHFRFQKSSAHVELSAIAACLYRWQGRDAKRTVLAGIPSGWRNNFYQAQTETFLAGEQVLKLTYRYVNGVFDLGVNGQSHQVSIVSCEDRDITVDVDGFQQKYYIANKGRSYFVHSAKAGTVNLSLQARFPEREAEKVKGGYESPMPAQVVKVLVDEGQAVKEGEGLVVLSSMKMESTIYAEEAGKVAEIYVEAGQNVEAEVLLLKLGKD